MKMLIELETPLVLVKHSVEGSEPYHTFEVWEVPEDAQALLDRAGVASTLVTTFEGERNQAFSECMAFLRQKYAPSMKVLLCEKSDVINAVEQGWGIPIRGTIAEDGGCQDHP